MRRPSMRLAAVGTLVPALVAFATLALPVVAPTDVIGPACWMTTALNDVYRLSFFVDPADKTVATVAGRTGKVLGTSVPVSGAAFLRPANDAGGDVVELLLTVAQSFTADKRSTLFLHVNFRFATLVGEGACQAANPAFAVCGEETSIDWTPVACP
jgi:hypothetical protein